ncbi:hypothetical protein [Intestinimonas butyriciproducens]|uniref:hypothetical protein n=1 Tax=Intestinimonas butyriciproducens TaxID=1297617 RepID=UPI001956621B|nr:hypothetical protein [Intestinimonas butyriciproducens]MBM6919238.1 hypothetical protein [Intestinimonas butyriciproducens]
MSWKPEEEEYSVDEIIAEFKNAQLREPKEREADAPAFDEDTLQKEEVPSPIPMPPRGEEKTRPELLKEESRERKEEGQEEKEKAEAAQEKEETKKAPSIPPLQPGESRVIDITSRVAARVQQEEKKGKASRVGGRKPSGAPVHQMEEQPEAAKKKKPQRREKDIPAEEPSLPPEEAREKRSPFKGWRKKKAEEPEYPEYPEYEDYEDFEYEEEAPREPIPYDFLFAADLEDLPKTLSNLGKKLRRLRLRSVLAFFFWALGLGVTALPSLALPIPEAYSFGTVPHFYFIALCVLLVLSMIAAGDVVFAGLYRLCRLRPTLDSAVLVSALAALAHGLWCIGQKNAAMPYICVAQGALFFAILSKRGRLLMLRRTYKAASLSTDPAAVCTKENRKERTLVYKVKGAKEADLSQVESPDATMVFSRVYAPLAIVAVLVLSVMATFGTGAPERFFPALGAITAMLAPVGLLLSTATPGVRISKKLFTGGSALLSARSARELAWGELAVITDSDLFPPGSVAISGMKIARSMSMEKVVAFAAGALRAAGGGVSHAFLEFAKQQYIFVPEPARVQYFETGGLSAQIGPDSVLCGTASFLMRMGIHVSEGRSIKSGVFVAVNGAFAGVFALKYSTPPQSYSAFRVLRVGRLRPLLATRDFNMTPLMVEDKFDLRPGRTDFPDVEERVALAQEEGRGKGKPLALLSRNTMLSFCECVTGARRLHRAVRFNLTVSLLCAVIGIGLMYYLSSTGNLHAAGPWNVLLYLILWYIPVWLYSALLSRY